jgi:3-polyprenyl-4-hydroxybenzoate decarboxylase
MIISATLNLAKITVIVDKDVDVLDMDEVIATIGARWQPDPASLIISQAKGMRLDPSAATRGMSSKIIIDATRQLPDEGGPSVYPELNRTLLKKECPEVFPMVEDKWGEFLDQWK